MREQADGTSADAPDRLRWELAVDAAGIGGFEWDIRTGRLHWDDRMLQIFGVDRDGFDPHIDRFWDRVHVDDRDALRRAVEAALATCGEFRQEYRIVRPGGEVRWLSARGRVTCDGAGQPVMLHGAGTDTTDAQSDREQAARILETMATAFFSLDQEWRFTYLNARGEQLLRRRRHELLGRVIWEEFPGADDLAFGRYYRQAMRTGEAVSFEERYPGLDAWFEVQVQPTPVGLAVYFVDISVRRAAEQAVRRAAEHTALLAEVSRVLSSTLDAQQAVGLLARALVPQLADWCLVTLVAEGGGLRDVGVWHADPDQRPVLDRYAETRLGAMGTRSPLHRALREGMPVDLRHGAYDALAPNLRSEQVRQLLAALRPASALLLPCVVGGRALGLLSLYRSDARAPFEDADVALAEEVARRAALALDNAGAYERARQAQRDTERALRRLALLARVGESLSTTLDGDEAVGRLARLVVPDLGDWCVVTVLDDDGTRRDVGWAHRDASREPDVAPYAAGLTAAAHGSPLSVALDAGRPVIHPAPEPGIGGLAVMPLNVRGRTLGALTLVTDPDRGPQTDEELDTALEVARRAAAVLDSARLYARSRRTAETLQRSLLTEPVQPDHLHIVTRYHPAVADAQVGGDWYDAFLSGTGTSTLVIGDVMGHDIGAAAAMGQLRTMVRTIACDRTDSPAGILTRVDAAAQALGLDTFATALVAQVLRAPGSGAPRRVRWSSAGHPPPVLVRPDGGVEVLRTAADLPLGIEPRTPRTDHDVLLEDDAVLLLYTDGLVERRGAGVEDGLRRLQEMLPPLARGPLEELCDAVLARMLTDGAEDDVGLVALRAHPESAPRPAEAGPARVAGEGGAGALREVDALSGNGPLAVRGPGDHGRAVLPPTRLRPEPTAAARSRRLVAGVCREAGMPADVSDVAALLTSEVVTNAVLHGRSDVRVSAHATHRLVRVEVGDDDPRHPRPQHQDVDALGGRGLALVEALAARWGVMDTPPGKTVWFEVTGSQP